MKTTRWDTTGVYSVELQVLNGQTCDFDGNQVECISLAEYHLDYAELVIEFRSKGYHSPMSMYGGPDNLGWPEEGSDERSLESAYLLCDGERTEIPESTQQATYAAYEPQILKADLPY